MVRYSKAACLPISIDPFEPSVNAFEELQASTIADKVSTSNWDMRCSGFFEHKRHIYENIISFMLFAAVADLIPKRFLCHSNLWNEIAFLHVAGGKRAVKVVTNRKRDKRFRQSLSAFWRKGVFAVIIPCTNLAV